MTRWSVVRGMALAALLAGCGGEAPSPASLATVTDSAGIRVVTNRIPPTGLPDYATVGPQHDLELGGGEAGSFVNVERVLTLSDGRLVVANREPPELRFFAPTGEYLGRAGAEGQGFGEFRDLSRMGRAGGDTIWTYDVRLQRLAIWDGEGTIIADAEAPRQDFVEGRFGDGSYLLVPGWQTRLHTDDPRNGVRRDPATYLRWFPGTGDSVTVGTFSHNELLVLEPEEAEGLVMGTPPFGRQTVRAVGPGRFYVGEQNQFEILSYDPDGTLREIIRVEGVDLTLSPDLVAATRRRTREGGDGEEAPWAQRFWDAVPETRPAFGEIRLDAMGHLWVAEHVAGVGMPRNWMVFSPDGSLLGLVEVPHDFRVLSIGRDHVIGAMPDFPGTEIIRRYPLRRR